ncbi:MAG: MurR/RpiR family transcriptional regulator, partial [Ruminococcaceae bacterium]|nr:MurR/RpiR family transcriptional regulator [Oscillospiraceae bacterium]
PDVRVLNTTNSSEMFEQMFRISKDDVMICMSFPRYSQRTIKAARFARTRGTPVVSITDTMDSPLVEESDSVLCASSDMASFIDSLVAPLSLINALIVAISLEKEQEISQTFAELEQIWDEYNVYEKVSDDGNYEPF